MGMVLPSKMMEHTFIQGLANNIMQNYTMPKSIKPILVVKPRATNKIKMDDVNCD